MIFRRGTETDVDDVIEIGKLYYSEADMKTMNYDLPKSRALVIDLLKNGLGIIAEEDNQIVGMIGAQIFNNFFSDSLMSQDILVYVVPEHRGLGIAKTLISIYIDWALNNGVRRENIFIGIDSGINTEKTEEVYKSLGFIRSGVKMRLTGG